MQLNISMFQLEKPILIPLFLLLFHSFQGFIINQTTKVISVEKEKQTKIPPKFSFRNLYHSFSSLHKHSPTKLNWWMKRSCHLLGRERGEQWTSHLPCLWLDRYSTTPSCDQQASFLFLWQPPSLISCPLPSFFSKQGENHTASSLLRCTALPCALSTTYPMEQAHGKAHDPVIKTDHHLQVQGTELKVAVFPVK